MRAACLLVPLLLAACGGGPAATPIRNPKNVKAEGRAGRQTRYTATFKQVYEVLYRVIDEKYTIARQIQQKGILETHWLQRIHAGLPQPDRIRVVTEILGRRPGPFRVHLRVERQVLSGGREWVGAGQDATEARALYARIHASLKDY